jgi:hypothetical protein
VWGSGRRFWRGDPPEWAKEVDWEMVEAEADKEIPAAITYSLSWDSPRDEEIKLKRVLRVKNRPNPLPLPSNRRSTGQRGDTDGLHNAVRRRLWGILHGR